VRALLEECQRAGEVNPALAVEQEAAALVALVDGIGIQATFEPDRFPPEEQTSLIDGQLGRLVAR